MLAGHQNARILVAEDDLEMARMLDKVLRRTGVSVVVVNDGRSALEAARDSIFDVVVTDNDMPFMDGVALVTELRRVPAYAKTPMILFTGSGRHEFPGLDAIGLEYMDKTDLVELIDRVDELVAGLSDGFHP